MSNDEIDRFVKSLTTAEPHLKIIKDEILNGDDEEASDNIQKASMRGESTRLAIQLTKNTTQTSALEKIVPNFGFESLEQWAQTHDRIKAVYITGNWVALTHAMGNSKSDVSGETNIFEYIEDDSKLQENRDSVKEQAESMCERTCFEAEDLYIVGARYLEIAAAFKSVK